MLYLRPYKKEDAKTILSWCEDETVFRKWFGENWKICELELKREDCLLHKEKY